MRHEDVKVASVGALLETLKKQAADGKAIYSALTWSRAAPR